MHGPMTLRACLLATIAMALGAAPALAQAQPQPTPQPPPQPAPTPAAKPAPQPTTYIDLDAIPDANARLAAAAGACAPKVPAHIATWCQGSAGQSGRDFEKRFEPYAVMSILARQDELHFTVPIQEVGKGFLFSPVEPQIHCDDTLCLYTPNVTVYVRTPKQVDFRAVTTVTLQFRVDGMWRARQYWGPRLTNVKATFWDEKKRKLGEGTALLPSPNQ